MRRSCLCLDRKNPDVHSFRETNEAFDRTSHETVTPSLALAMPNEDLRHPMLQRKQDQRARRIAPLEHMHGRTEALRNFQISFKRRAIFQRKVRLPDIRRKKFAVKAVG